MKKNKYPKLLFTGKALLALDKNALLSAGFSASALRSAGFSASALRSAGFSASEVLSAGFSASEVLSAEFSASEVLSAGFSASALRSAGFSASALLSAGFSASALRSAGFSASEVLSAGFSASALLSAGFSASEVLSAGFSASALRSAGFSASEVDSLNKLVKAIPKLVKPYTKLWDDIKNKKRIHMQSKWGPDTCPDNVCGTPMCTAGHLINMAGTSGYKLKDATSWSIAASLIHEKAHPGIPHQNFSNIPQDIALAYIERMAEIEDGK